ncbi:hypothetical protein ABB37_09114 [Leptomonas pyrrhocoris]|uniref:Symplekin C-terminal domain-containing protein n=1 Tax=Leptomonas pyrrhocoris TaxID=157538 RepID=A0A0M9FRB3_LEPPY|nr:hypothetical protein ABB37_09114 [Leptomonas pyrrhocoris]KPA74413.1 hypothetical protein ABB37_09114 [Leptomonas pyrrhocoris]|eukprot:XP_015652852.1 hypothetical protein ABB37_09114 [Leptomonas pyrrhocoris]
MQALLAHIEEAEDVGSLNLACLHELRGVEDARETIELLLDAYNSLSGTAREVLQKQCVLRSLAELLETVQSRHTALSAPASSAPTTLSTYAAFWQRHLQHHQHKVPTVEADSQWVLTPDDHLLLSMFLNETATTTDQRAFHYWSRAAVVLFPLATALAYPMALPTGHHQHRGDKSVHAAADDNDEEAETTRASLESELHSMREIIAKRFTTSIDNVRRVTSYDDARRCQQRGVWALVGCLAHPTAGARVAEELEAAVDGMLQPLHRALQEQLNAYAGKADGTGAARGGAHKTTSALLLTALLQDVEDVLWAIPHVLEGVTDSSSSAAALEQLCARVATSTTESLLKFAQQYIAHRQQRQMESMEEDGADRLGAGGSSGGGAAGGKLKDIFRVYHVQRSVQRVLSVALQLRPTTPIVAQKKTGAAAADLLLVSDAAFSGLQAAASAFGGVVHVTDPFVLSDPSNVVEGEATCAADTTTAAAATALSELGQSVAESWADSTVGGGRLRDCRSILAAPHHLPSGPAGVDGGGILAGGGGADGDFDFFNEEAATLLGRREAYLKTSLGPVTASALVDMVMLTVSQMDFLSEDAMQELHRRGLEEMQLVAAYQAQREEVEKLRQMERQGVEAIPPGKLIEHVKDSVALHTRGVQILRRVSARARLERAAFSSVLSAYAHVRGEAEARVRQTQALIARCLVQLPPSLADSAMDELLLSLRKELAKARALKEKAEAAAATASSNAGLTILFQDHSYYQLTLQALFMFYATQAPIEDRSGVLNSALMLGGANLDEEGNEDGMAGGGVGGEALHTAARLSIEVDSPIAFLYDDDVHRASYDVGSKRPREAAENAGGEDDGAAGNVNSSERVFGFLNDTVAAPSTYSHVLCRVLELILAARLNSILVDVLLQAPVLTRYVWHHLYKDFCLSADRTRCVIGMGLVRALAVLRPVYRTCAVNILLQLSLSTHAYARRLAITAIDALLSATTAQGAPLLDKAAETQIVRYAKTQLFAIPAYQRSGAASKLKRAHEDDEEGQATTAGAAAATTSSSDEAAAKGRARMSVVLERHLGLFLMLCARQPRDLFPALLEVFQQCVDRENITMMQLLPANVDVRRMTQDLFKADAATFVSAVLPLLRKRCKEARPLVQAMLWAVREQLGTMAREASAAAAALATSADGIDPASQASAAASLEALRSISTAVVGHAKAMYELSGIPLGDSSTSHSLPDIRYVAPFLGFLSAKELRQTYLKSFLLFVQVQLQFQRRYHGAFHRLPARERTYVLEATELRAFQIQVLREVFVKCPVAFQDGVARGLTLVNFFVFLHRAPQESQSRSSALHGGLHLGQGGLGADAGATGGILDGLHDGTPNALTSQKEKTEELPPISVGTTKEVVSLCLELTRSFDNTTSERLYGPAEVQKALQLLMNPPPVPSQLMATVLEAAELFMRTRNIDFIKFVVQTVLTPLERASVWDTDPKLWKGVILFTECYYRESSNFLVNLPDQVLTQALREHPNLCALFTKEHGNNASFGHILGSL